MSRRPVAFGLIGAGWAAQTYAQAFQRSEEARVVAVADIRTAAATALAESLGVRACASIEAMFAEVALDAVVVCTPPVTHVAIARYFIDRGIHVLCEKPLTIDSASARALLAAARQARVTVSMASKFRFVEDVVRAKSLLLSGLIGEVVFCHNAFTSRIDMGARWNADPEISGGGVLIDNGTHSVDLVRYLLGPLVAIQVTEGRRVQQQLAVEDTVSVWVRTDGGALGSIDLSWSVHEVLDGYLHVQGTQGTLKVGWATSGYRLRSGGDWVAFGRGYDKGQAFQGQLANFARAVRGEEGLLVTPADALASVETIEAGYASLREGRWVPLDRIPAAGSRPAAAHA